MKYFSLTGKIKKGTAFAYTSGPTPIAHELIPNLLDKIVVPFDLYLKKVTLGKGGLETSDDLSGLKFLWLDYLPNNLAWPLMSEKMKVIVDRNLSGNEFITWMKIRVRSSSESHDYFIPRFEKKLNVLNENRTLFVEGTDHIIRPVYSQEKIKSLSSFQMPQRFWQIPSSIYINETIKNQLLESKITGIDFEDVSLS